MSYVNDLQSAWDRYVIMDQATVISVTNPQSAAYEPDFAQALGIIYSQKLFGWTPNPNGSAGSNSFPGAGEGWIGPTRST